MVRDKNALSAYADLDFLERVFYGMASRVRNGEVLRNAVEEIQANYALLESVSIKEFFFVKENVIQSFNQID